MEAHAQKELLAAGRDKLADELYDLRCDLAGLILTVEQAAAMQARADALEPLVGEHLQRMLAAED